MERVVFGLILMLLLTGMLLSAFIIQPAKAEWTGTVYIRADGSIDPPYAPIITYDNITYTLTDNITSSADGIVVERDNIVIDGAGYTLEGTGAEGSKGIDLSGRRNVTVQNTRIKNFCYGIWLAYSSNNSVSGNNVANNWSGIGLSGSSNNNIGRNHIANNYYGIWLSSSSNNIIYHNNFINNSVQAKGYSQSANTWDDGYPSGGNYWSDYVGVDLFSGPYQSETGSDGVGDAAHEIYADNRDRYPLMAPFNTFDAGTWNGTAYNVDVVSNSTVSNFQLNTAQRTMSFNVTGVEGTAVFCRITIPNIIVEELWHGNYTVLLNGEPWPYRNWTDTANTYIYLNYTHSEHQIVIIPEFPSAIIPPIFMTFSILAIIFTRKRFPKNFKT